MITDSLDVKTAINISIKNMADKYLLDLDPNPLNYRLFPAKKDGFRDEDLPEV